MFYFELHDVQVGIMCSASWNYMIYKLEYMFQLVCSSITIFYKVLLKKILENYEYKTTFRDVSGTHEMRLTCFVSEAFGTNTELQEHCNSMI